MGYKLENKDIRINNVNLIGYGTKGNVYKYRREAIKIFPNGDIPDGVIDKDSCEVLKKISTQAILLPRKTATYNHQFAGYSLKLVQKNTHGNIVTMRKGDLIDSVSTLENDISILSNNRVLLDGITPNNVLISDQIYITDPSRYTLVYDDRLNSARLLTFNQFQLYLLLCEMITSGLKKCGVPNSELKKMRHVLDQKDDDVLPSEYFDSLLDTHSTFKSYVKKRSL